MCLYFLDSDVSQEENTPQVDTSSTAVSNTQEKKGLSIDKTETRTQEETSMFTDQSQSVTGKLFSDGGKSILYK